jgi:prepilin-type processing-associated H-X9-DG protein
VTASPEPQSRPLRNGPAIASLILGIIGPCTAGLASVPGLILGIIGIGKATKSGGAVGGKGLAVAGTVLSALGCLMLLLAPVLVAILLPALSSAREEVYQAKFANSLKQLNLGAQVYAAEHNNRLPPPDTWHEWLNEDYLGVPAEEITAAPTEPDAGRAVAMNAHLQHADREGPPEARAMSLGRIRDPGRTVLFFECAAGSPPAGGPELLPPEPRYGGEYVIAFCDGHVERVPPEEVGKLVWDPLAED